MKYKYNASIESGLLIAASCALCFCIGRASVHRDDEIGVRGVVLRNVQDGENITLPESMTDDQLRAEQIVHAIRISDHTISKANNKDIQDSVMSLYCVTREMIRRAER